MFVLFSKQESMYSSNIFILSNNFSGSNINLIKYFCNMLVVNFLDLIMFLAGVLLCLL